MPLSGPPIDGAETDTGWVKEGFLVATATLSNFYSHYYLAEFRQYYGFDDTLQTAYNFGYRDNPALLNWMEYFTYQDGLLINYWDTSQSDNDTSQHPGQGMILPIDAHPDAMYRADGGVWQSRVQAYDSTFGLDSTDAITLHWSSTPSHHDSQPPVSVFNDNNQYYNAATPNAGVINPHTGTIIQVKDINESGEFMQVQVRPAE